MLHVTEAAYREIKRLLEGQGKPHGGLRIGVIQRSGSCGGPTFTLNFVDGPAGDEQAVPVRDVSLILRPEAHDLLKDYTLDFSDGMFSEGFRFIPGAKRCACRCGKAIAVSGVS